MMCAKHRSGRNKLITSACCCTAIVYLLALLFVSQSYISFSALNGHVHISSRSSGRSSSRTHHQSPGRAAGVPVRRVVLLSYYRSGSTFAGQLFNFNRDAFYWFEPLAGVTRDWKWFAQLVSPRNYFHFDNGTEKVLSKAKAATLTNTMRALLSCNLTALDDRVLGHSFVSRASSTYSLHSCHQSTHNVAECLPLATGLCLRSGVVAAKVIRLHMRHTRPLLRSDPSYRVLHLVRDPAGLVESWKKVRRLLRPEELRADARMMCVRMWSDASVRRRLEKEFPGRVMLLRYEDLVTSPEQVARRVYNSLLNLPVPANLTRRFHSLLTAKSDDTVFGTRRSNGTATAFSWHDTIDSNLRSYIADHCRDVRKELGYNES